MRIIKKAERIKMPWKNGAGISYEIDREPAGASEYDWRLSEAHVECDGPFSLYPDHDRWLVIWEGAGLRLNEKKQLPLVPFHFRGDEKIETKLLKGSISDVGLIYRRGRVTAGMEIVSGKLKLETGTHYLISKISSEIEGVCVDAGDTAVIQVKEAREITVPAQSLHVFVTSVGDQRSS